LQVSWRAVSKKWSAHHAQCIHTLGQEGCFRLSSEIHDIPPMFKHCGTFSAPPSMMFHGVGMLHGYCLISATHDVPRVLKHGRLRLLGVETLMIEGAGWHSSNL
jgi:hypothetical protein